MKCSAQYSVFICIEKVRRIGQKQMMKGNHFKNVWCTRIFTVLKEVNQAL